MNNKITNRCTRQIQLQRLPVVTIIERHINSRLRAGKEQPLLFGIFSNHVYLCAGALIGWETVDDAHPGLATIVRAIELVLLCALRNSSAKADVGEDVGGIDIVVSSFNSHEARTRRKIGEVRDVVPCLAAVHRVIDLSVAAARPHDTLLYCRDREICNRRAERKRIRTCSGSWRRSRRGSDTARYHRLTFRCREIGTERFPRLCAVTRYDNAVVTDV